MRFSPASERGRAAGGRQLADGGCAADRRPSARHIHHPALWRGRPLLSIRRSAARAAQGRGPRDAARAHEADSRVPVVTGVARRLRRAHQRRHRAPKTTLLTCSPSSSRGERIRHIQDAAELQLISSTWSARDATAQAFRSKGAGVVPPAAADDQRAPHAPDRIVTSASAPVEEARDSSRR